MRSSFYLPWTCCRGFLSGLMNSDPEQLFSTVRLRPTVAIGFRFFKGCVDNALKMFCSCCFPFAGGEKKSVELTVHMSDIQLSFKVSVASPGSLTLTAKHKKKTKKKPNSLFLSEILLALLLFQIALLNHRLASLIRLFFSLPLNSFCRGDRSKRSHWL